jgi:preflagellin peptidase FlaK
MAALTYFWLAQFLIAIVLLLFASYSDIIVRKVSDFVWIVMAMLAVLILVLKVIVESKDVTLNLIGVIPVLGLISYFLICEWVVDFDGKEVNYPWVFIIILSITVIIFQTYWVGYGISQMSLLGIFLSAFLIMEFIMFYLDYKDYNATIIRNRDKSVPDKSERKNIKLKKTHEKLGAQNELKSVIKSKQAKDEKAIKRTASKVKSEPKKKVKNNSEVQNKKLPKDILKTRISWVFFILILFQILLTIIIYNFLATASTLELMVGAVGGLIPIIFLTAYFLIFDWSLLPEESSSEKSRSNLNSDKDSDPEDELDIQEEWIVRRKGLGEKIGWVLIIILGFVVIINAIIPITEETTNVPNYYLATFSVMVWLVIFYGLYNLGVPKGGADTKALMALTVLFPTYIFFSPILINSTFIDLAETFLGIGHLFPFAFSVLINATIITLFIPLSLLIYNASKKHMKFPQCIFGYKMDLKLIPEKHVWLMEHVDENGNIHSVIFPRGGELENETMDKLKELGVKDVWVTPKIPFIIPMTIGFVLNFIVGNLLFVMIFGLSGF